MILRLLLFVLPLLFAGCGNSNTANQTTSTINNGIVAHWSFDNGDARDDSGNGLDGNAYGTIPTADRFGKAGSALSFDGTAYILVPNSPTLNINGEGTVALWMKGNGDAGTLLWKRYGSGNTGWTLYIGLTNTIFGYLNNDASFALSAFTTGQWQHIALIYEQNRIKLYVNGVLRSSAANPNGFQATDADLLIGRDESGDYYKGAIDDVRIYNRALTDLEIVELFNSQ